MLKFISLYILALAGLVACQPAAPDQAAAALSINQLMDDWHQAAATADEVTFFNTLRHDAIYLGTDPTERWTKERFEDWSYQYFKRDTAWAFQSHDRALYFSDNGRTAWFEELLDTQMGPCRGSGVLSLESEGWKLAHYNLALLVNNDDMGAVRELIKARGQQLVSPQDSL